MTTSTERAARSSEIRALTGMRAVVATLVLLFHFQGPMLPYIEQVPFLRPFISAGWTGVEAFFVLSGFLITLAYGERMGTAPSVAKTVSFLVSRLARTWPAWAVVTVVMGAWLWTVRSLGWPSEFVASHPSADALTLLRQLTMTQLWGEEDLNGSSYVLPGWSISAEWTAYLAFPVLVLLLRPLHRLPSVLLLLLSVAAMAPLSVMAFVSGPQDFAQPWVLRIACGFTAGMLAALAVRRLRRSERTEAVALTGVWTCLFLIALGTLWAGWRVQGTGPHDYSGVIVVVFPLLIAGLTLTERGPARVLSGTAMTYGGRLSYSLYLVHFVVLDIVLTVFMRDGEPEGNLRAGMVLVLPLLILVSFALSAALYHGVEEPGRRLVLRGLHRLTGPARLQARTRATAGRGIPASGVAVARVSPITGPRTASLAVSVAGAAPRQLPPIPPRPRVAGGAERRMSLGHRSGPRGHHLGEIVGTAS